MKTLSQKRASEILGIKSSMLKYHLDNGNIEFTSIAGIRYPYEKSIQEIKLQLDLIRKGVVLNLKDSCLFLNIHDSRFRRHVENGNITSIPILGMRYWQKDELENFKQKHIEPMVSMVKCLGCGKEIYNLRTGKLYCSRTCKIRINSKVKYAKTKA